MSEKTLDEAVVEFLDMIGDTDSRIALKPTKIMLPGLWTEEDVAQAREIVDRAHKEAFGV